MQKRQRIGLILVGVVFAVVLMASLLLGNEKNAVQVFDTLINVTLIVISIVLFLFTSSKLKNFVGNIALDKAVSSIKW